MTRHWLIAGALAGLSFTAALPGVTPHLPAGWTARHVTPLAYLPLNSPRAFKLGLARRGERWYLFVAEGGGNVFQGNGFRVIDVTDAAHPVAVAHVPVEYGDGQLTLHGHLLIAGRQLPFPPPSAGGSVEYPYKGVSARPTALATLFDISDPHAPVEVGWFLPRIGRWAEGKRGPEDVLVDMRGNIFVSDGRDGGLWVLRYAPR